MSVSAEITAPSRWQPRRPQPRGEHRRNRLLMALEQQLQIHPFAAVNIADVADAAGLGRAAFYFYFSSKHNAVTQLLGDMFDEEIARVAEILYGPGDPHDNIVTGMAFIVDSRRERSTLLAAMLDARNGDADARLIWQQWLGRYEDFAQQFIIDSTAIAEPTARVLAHVLIGVNERALRRHLRCGGDRQAADELHTALVQIWEASLRKTTPVTTTQPRAQTCTEGIDLDIPTSYGTLSAKHLAAVHDELASSHGRAFNVMAHGIGATQDSGLAPYAQPFAAIVNISSFAGLIGSPPIGSHAATKFAIRGPTMTAAIELGSRGIWVNSVHPGYLRTPLLDGIPDQAIHGRLAIERVATSADVTPVVLFATSSDAGYCTGAEFAVDGGWSAGEPTPIFVAPGTEVPEGMFV